MTTILQLSLRKYRAAWSWACHQCPSLCFLCWFPSGPFPSAANIPHCWTALRKGSETQCLQESANSQKDQPWQKCFSFLIPVFSSWLGQEPSRDFGIPLVGTDFGVPLFVSLYIHQLKIRAHRLKEVKELAEITRSHRRAKRRETFIYSTCANKLSLESKSQRRRWTPGPVQTFIYSALKEHIPFVNGANP